MSTDRTRRTCECGRTFASYAGVRVHERTCPVEAARSAVLVGAVERGDPDPWGAVQRWRAAGRS